MTQRFAFQHAPAYSPQCQAHATQTAKRPGYKRVCRKTKCGVQIPRVSPKRHPSARAGDAIGVMQARPYAALVRWGGLACYRNPVDTGISDEQFWSYVPGFESPDQYEAFEHYRDAGPRLRSLADTARALRLGYATVCTWAREKGWDERVLAFDGHRIAQRAELARAREQVADQAWADKRTELLERWHSILREELTRFEASLRKRSGSLRPNELTRALDILIKYSNLANGDATERIDVPLDLSNHTPEQLEALEALRALQRKSE